MRAWGRFVYRRRWLVLIATVAISAAGIGLLIRGGNLTNDNTFDFESAHALNLMTDQLHQPTEITFVFSSPNQVASDPGFRSAVAAAIAPVRYLPHVASVTLPWDLPPAVTA